MSLLDKEDSIVPSNSLSLSPFLSLFLRFIAYYLDRPSVASRVKLDGKVDALRVEVRFSGGPFPD
jgi:hypothetical protein